MDDFEHKVITLKHIRGLSILAIITINLSFIVLIIEFFYLRVIIESDSSVLFSKSFQLSSMVNFNRIWWLYSDTLNKPCLFFITFFTLTYMMTFGNIAKSVHSLKALSMKMNWWKLTNLKQSRTSEDLRWLRIQSHYFETHQRSLYSRDDCKILEMFHCTHHLIYVQKKVKLNIV